LSFTISNYGENEITGYLQNLKVPKDWFWFNTTINW
jgi:hypothetical protein